MGKQNKTKTCENCGHWFLNPHVEYGDITKAEGRCLVSDTFTRSDNVCNVWEPSLLFEWRDKHIANLEEVPRMIPVGERLPKDGVKVFILFNDGCVAAGMHYAHDVVYFNEYVKFIKAPCWIRKTGKDDYELCAYDTVTHWMPFPSVPECQMTLTCEEEIGKFDEKQYKKIKSRIEKENDK